MKKENLVQILNNISQDPQQSSPNALILLIKSFDFSNEKSLKIQYLEFLNLLKSDNYRKPLARYISHLFAYYDNPTDYAELGYAHSKGFFSELNKKIIQKILPPLNEHKSIRAIIKDLFFADKQIKNVFIEHHVEMVEELLKTIFKDEEDLCLLSHQKKYRLALINALPILSIRVGSIGSENFFIEKNFSIQYSENIFQQLHLHITNYCNHTLKGLSVEQDLTNLKQNILTINKLVNDLYHKKNTLGIDGLFSLKATRDMIKRIETLITLLQADTYNEYIHHQAVLIENIIKEEASRYGIRGFVSQEIEHLSNNVVEQTSIVGEHYNVSNISEYTKMFYKALKGGVIVGLFSSVKIFISYVNFPPFVQGFLYGLNYAIAFVLLYHFHFILATKQPAYTAARVAKALAKIDANKKNYHQFIKEIIGITRTQFISIMGNISSAFPIAILWSLVFAQIFGHHIATEEKAHHLLHDNYFIAGGGLLYAAVAGFWLMISGFISGYFDNLTLISKIPERIKKHPYLQHKFSAAKIEKFAEYIRHNLGGIMGNSILGFLLGLTVTFGNFFGIPIDIRHIAFASANEGYAFIAMFKNITTEALIFSALGVIGIGLVNVFVSFFLTIWVAMNTQRRRLSVYGYLLKILFFYFLKHPIQFFCPLPRWKRRRRIL